MTFASIPETAAGQIAAVIDELLVLLDLETAAIKAFDFDDILAGKEAKHRLTQDYRELTRQLAEQHHSGAPLSDDTRAYMAALDQRLSDAVERNAQALQRALQTNQSLVAAIVASTNRQRAGVTPYQAPAHMRRGAYAASPAHSDKNFQV